MRSPTREPPTASHSHSTTPTPTPTPHAVDAARFAAAVRTSLPPSLPSSHAAADSHLPAVGSPTHGLVGAARAPGGGVVGGSNKHHRHGLPTIESLKEAVMRSQAKTRKKSRLDQATVVSNSPPALESPKGTQAGPAAPADHMSSPPPPPKSRTDSTASPILSSTSSYPFPTMLPLRSVSSSSVGAAFNVTMSPGQGPFDKPLPSGTTTPASFAFHPLGGQAVTPYENPDFPTPNMYELALLLHSEPGIEAFWSNVVKITTMCYKAERVTLAVPSDSTDLENTPWGQKATFNMAEDDTASVNGERGRTGGHNEYGFGEDDYYEGAEVSEDGGAPLEPRTVQEMDDRVREAENDFESTEPVPIDTDTGGAFEPVTIGLQDPHSLETGSNSDWVSDAGGQSPLDVPQPPPMPPESLSKSTRIDDTEPKGKVFAKLQPLNAEPDALLDGSGVSRVLQRGKTVVLSREYRDVKTHLEEMERRRKEAESTRTSTTPEKKVATPGPSTTTGFGAALGKLEMPPMGVGSKLPSQPPTPLFFVGKGVTRRRKTQSKGKNFTHNPVLQYYSTQQHLHHVQSRAHSPRRASSYEEYEQPVTSPWSQSPAPSPAPRPDPSENPFFALPKVDEDTFNPLMGSPVYSAQEPVNAIGCESSWTVIHIPLVHPSLSKTVSQSDCRMAQAPKNGSLFNGGLTRADDALGKQMQQKKAPIAILSMLSPVIPYPSNLIHSLSHFAPLVATAFALAQTHSSVLNQLVQLRSQQPSKRSKESRRNFSFTSESVGSPENIYENITSPSEGSSALASSSAASPAWDLGITASENTKPGLGQPAGPSSPAVVGLDSSEGYFTTAQERRKIFSRQNSGTVLTLGSVSEVAEKEEQAKAARRLQRPTLKGKERSYYYPVESISESTAEHDRPLEEAFSEDIQKTPTQEDEAERLGEAQGSQGTQAQDGGQKRQRRKLRRKRTGLRVGRNPHTLLHSYGADYSATFQSLAASTTSVPVQQFSRQPGEPGSGSNTPHNAHEMPPPSNKLLRTIIDSIPVHVFTAAPDTGQTTWVNARMLAYRGLTVEEYMKNPWETLHADDKDDYTRRWTVAVRKGEPFSTQVRVKRFDGVYRWFMIRAVPLRDQRGIIVHWFGTNMDTHDQRIAEVNASRQAEMAESESKYRSLANSSPQIVFAATANDGITFANTQWLGYSGQTLNHALRLGFMENVHAQDRFKCSLPGFGGGFVGSSGKTSPHMQGWEIAETPEDFNIQGLGGRSKRRDSKGKTSINEEGKPTFSTELRLKDKHGEYRWHLVRCVSVESNFGTGEGLWFGTCTDINDHKLLEQKLKEANEAAQKTMDSKTRFLANMSHEIRTPLIGISGMVNFLLDTPLNGEQLDYCHTISQSSDGLLSVINDILDLSKVEAGMMRLNPEWFRIHSLVEDAHELLSTMAIAKDLELNFIVEDDVPPVVCGDRVRLRQVLLNVIGNAIKFTTKGEVFSRCSVLKDAEVGEDEVMLQFECHDTGPGFDSKEEELMFKPFSQIDGSSTRAHGGSGLGLVISRQLVELHGGRLTASSCKGKGSTFVGSAKFRLPREENNSGMSATATAEGASNITRTMQGLSSKQQQTVFASDRFTESPGETSPGLTYSGETPSTTASPASSAPSTQSMPSATSGVSAGSVRSPTSSLQAISISPPAALDPSSMRFSLPTEAQQKYRSSCAPEKQPDPLTASATEIGRAVTPPLYSILIVSEQHFSRIAIAHHIKITLPKNAPHQITTVGDFDECKTLLGGDDPVVFTHVVVNLPNHEEIITLISQVLASPIHSLTTILVITNPTQRTVVIQGATAQCNQLSSRLQFIYKPIKPSRFGTVFDPANERDASMDRNRDSAQQVVETQKKVFSRLEDEVGNRGYKVLLVEDNLVNQKVLLRFLAKVGLDVETASDGEDCVKLVLSKQPGYYGLILCDLHMPRKDGFQATSEIRQHEREYNWPPVPIVALSANVMSDVAERCQAAGFSRYVSKPVDFRELSATIKDLLPNTPSKESSPRLSAAELPRESAATALVAEKRKSTGNAAAAAKTTKEQDKEK